MKDHTAVETILGGALIMIPVKECWSWKDMDVARVEEDAWDLYVLRSIISQDSLEEYAQYIMDFTTSLSGQHGRLLRLTPRSHS